MTTMAPSKDRHPLHEDLAHWIDQGFYLRVDPHLDSLVASGHPDDALLAVRALRNLGADRTGDALSMRLPRRFDGHLPAHCARLRTVLGNRGPYFAHTLMQRAVPLVNASSAQQAEWWSVHMRVAASLRDFEAVDRLRSQARALCDDDPWLWVEWSYCCLDRDDMPAAQQAVGRALELAPGLRSATQWQAALLRRAGRRDEAHELLQKAFEGTECAGYGWQLFASFEERGAFDVASAVLDRIEALSPRADERTRSRLAARRCDMAMHLGDLAAARDWSAQVRRSLFYMRIHERLGHAGSERRRVQLAVPWVRQHWLTCAPATLTALAAWWRRPVDHLDLAEAICYDGTSWPAERRWAAQSGYVVREFSADWATTCALIDAGMPFTLTTNSTDFSHLQAVVGYDALRRTLLVCDPMDPEQVEFDAEAAFERWRADGPRGMVFVPAERQADLEAVALPDAEAWDGYHATLAALERHDRDAAVLAVTELARQAPGHWLHLRAARSVAVYDGDENAILNWTERLLEQFPQESTWRLSKAASLWAIGGRDAHLEWMAGLAGEPQADATTLVRYADRLCDDDRRRPLALQAVRRALRREPRNDGAWAQWGALRWAAGEREAVLPLYRAAACLRDRNEDRAALYARVCRLCGLAEQGLDFLRSRVQVLGRKSPGPACTLFDALEACGRADEGFEQLDAAMVLRPDDAVLAAFVAQARLRYGQADFAERALSRAEAGTVARSALHHVRALLAEHRLDFAGALAHAEAAVAMEPLNIGLHQVATRLLDRLRGRPAAVQWLRQVTGRFPNHVELQRLLYDWLPDEPQLINAQLAHLAVVQPDDAWVRRERAVQCVRQRRYDEAVAYALSAAERSGDSSACLGILGWARQERSGYAAGAADLRRAIERDADNTHAVARLIGQAPDQETGRDALAFVARQLAQQALVGDGVLTWQAWAQDLLPHVDALAELDALALRHPQAWQFPVAQALQRVAAQQWTQALEVLDRAQGRFGLVARVHVERAAVLRLLQRRDDASTAAESALALEPAGNRAVRQLVDALNEGSRDWPRALRALDRAVALAPADADLRALRGWVHEQAGADDLALADLQAALAQDAEPQWVWNTVERCTERLRQPARLLDIVAALETARPQDAWVRLARARYSRDAERGLRATEEATTLNPRLVAAWQARFERLLELERFDEIQQRAQQLPWPDGGPLVLRAWQARGLRAQGRKAEAVQQLKGLLDGQVADWSCWRLLADWLDEDNEHEHYLQAADQLLRLGPTEAQSHLYRGHALIKCNRPAEALAPLKRALAIDPSYRFAMLQLTDAACSVGEPAQALAELQAVWTARPALSMAGAGVRLACALRHEASVRLWLQRALQAEAFATDEVAQLLDLVREAGFGGLVEPLQRDALMAGTCALGAGIDWVVAQRRGQSPAMAEHALDAAMAASQGIALPLAILRTLAKGASARALQDFVDRWQARLRADDLTWGETSYALLQFEQTGAVCRWLADWRERPEAPNWVLTNLCVSLASGGRLDEAAEVSETVYARDPFDVDALLWRCVHRALSGEAGEFAAALGHLERQPLESWMRGFLPPMRAWLQTQREGATSALVQAIRTARPSANHALRHFLDRLRDRLLSRPAPVWRRALIWLRCTL